MGDSPENGLPRPDLECSKLSKLGIQHVPDLRLHAGRQPRGFEPEDVTLNGHSELSVDLIRGFY